MKRKRVNKPDTISYFVLLNAAKPIQHTVYTEYGMVSIGMSVLEENEVRKESMNAQILADLNEEQREAVMAPLGPVLVIAGPGTGKTQIMVHRMAYLIAYGRVEAWRILALTYTSKAAQEMIERLNQLVGNAAKGIGISTFHSQCLKILRAEIDAFASFGLTSEFELLSTDKKQMEHIFAAMKTLQLGDQGLQAKEIHDAIVKAKDWMITPENLLRRANKRSEEIVARVYEEYQKRLRVSNCIDWGDTIWLVYYLLLKHPDVLLKYRRRFRHILVDEAQDSNQPQYELIRLLGGGKFAGEKDRSVYMVGDPDQTIYSFRGAQAAIFDRFRRDFPSTRIIGLRINYRSTQNILDVAQSIVRLNPDHMEMGLTAVRGRGEPIVLYERKDEDDEAKTVLQEIQSLLERGVEKNLSDIAIIYRMNRQSRALIDACIERRIAFSIQGGSFWDRKEIQDLVGYLKVIAQPENDASLRQLIKSTNLAIRPTTLDALGQWALEKRWSLYTAIQRSAEHPFLKKTHQPAVSSFATLITGLIAIKDSLPLSELILHIADQSGYMDALKEHPESEDRLENVEELRHLLGKYKDFSPSQALDQFLAYVSLVMNAQQSALNRDERRQPVQGGGIRLLTIHGSKGQEYSTTFVVGLDEGTLPNNKAMNDLERLREERRLLYVACSRAHSRLYLLWPRRRGESHFTMASRFLGDIPSILLRKIPSSS